jgi:hypothetical protein
MSAQKKAPMILIFQVSSIEPTIPPASPCAITDGAVARLPGHIGIPMPAAVDVFTTWFKSLPKGADLEAAAAAAIARIDQGNLAYPEVKLLRALLVNSAGSRAPGTPTGHQPC